MVYTYTVSTVHTHIYDQYGGGKQKHANEHNGINDHS